MSEISDLRVELHQLDLENKRLRSQLKEAWNWLDRLEFDYDKYQSGHYCPECLGEGNFGHKKDCKLAKWLETNKK
jgi:hypothetical protein